MVTFREASKRVQSVFFEAILPRYLEKYGIGRGYQLVFHLTNDLDQRTYMDIANGPKPSFSTTQRMHQLMHTCPIHIDGGAKRGPKGEIVLGQLTSVTLRRLSISLVTLYAGSFFAKGYRAVDPLSVALMETLIREFIRHFEQELPTDRRPILLRETNPALPIPFTESDARYLDYRHILFRTARIGLAILATLIAAQWLWTTFVR